MLLTTKQVAERLGVSPGRVRQLILAQRLPATRVGRDWLIDEDDMEHVAERPVGYPKGRPRKE